MIWCRETNGSASDNVSLPGVFDRSLRELSDGNVPIPIEDPEFHGVETIKILASLVSMLGCFFIIVTYLLFPPLRLHHSTFILWMALMGMTFHGVVILQMPNAHTTCCGTGPLIQLTLLGQEFYFFVLAFTFYFTTKFPFHNSRWLGTVCHIVVWLVSGTMTYISAVYGTERVNSYGFCWYSSFRSNSEKLIICVFVIPVSTGYLTSIAWYIIATKRVRRGARASQHSNARTNLDSMRRYLLWSFMYWWIIAIPYLLRHHHFIELNSTTEKVIRFIGRMAIAFKGTLSALVWAKSTSMRSAYRLWREGNWDDYMKVYEATWILRRQIVDFATKGIQRSAALTEARAHTSHSLSSSVSENDKPPLNPRYPRIDLLPACHEFRSFELEGGEEQAAVFRDYRPEAFEEIRLMSGITSEQYVQSFAGRTRERFSSGKSGSFLYYTGDQMFILKTCTPSEMRYLLHILPEYTKHLKENPRSYLCRYVGCHELVMEHHSVLFIVLTNMLNNSNVPVDEFYDLKGSWVGRSNDSTRSGVQRVCKYCGRDFIVGMSKEACDQNPNPDVGHDELVTGKDLNWSCRKLGLPRDVANGLGRQLYADSKFLERINSMDYSLILGIAHTSMANPQAISHSQSQKIPVQVPEISPGDSEEPCLVSFETPYTSIATPVARRSSTVGTEVFVGDECVVYMGIIDILTPWSLRKCVEHWMRVHLQCRDAEGISCVAPSKYAQRFRQNVVGTVILGGSQVDCKQPNRTKQAECILVNFNGGSYHV